MARLLLPIIACLIFGSQVAGSPVLADERSRVKTESDVAIPGDVQDLVFFEPQHPVFIRTHVQINAKGFRQLRDVRIDTLFTSLDVNQDGKLDSDEAKKIPGPGEISTTPLVADIGLDDIDVSPQDREISRSELAAYFDRVLGSTFAIARKQLTAAQLVELFQKLDSDANGRIGQPEVENGPATLQKLDLDDDGLFSLPELSPFQPEGMANTAQPAGPNEADGLPFRALSPGESSPAFVDDLLSRYDIDRPRDGKLSAKELGFEDRVLQSYDNDGDGRLDKAELNEFVRHPQPHVRLLIELPTRGRVGPGISVVEIATRGKAVNNKAGEGNTDNANSAFVQDTRSRLTLNFEHASLAFRVKSSANAGYDNRQFYKVQFLRADVDKNRYLDEQEFPALALPNADFERVDTDKDKMIVVDEVVAFVALEAESAQSRLVMTVAKDGKSLFELLDSDNDSRLSPRDFQRAYAAIAEYDANHDQEVAATEIAGRYELVFEIGKPSLFNQRNMPVDAGTPMMQPSSSSSGLSGPAWFRKMDRNRDGDVSRREFLGAQATFDQLDKDADGLIDPVEAATAQ